MASCTEGCFGAGKARVISTSILAVTLVLLCSLATLTPGGKLRWLGGRELGRALVGHRRAWRTGKSVFIKVEASGVGTGRAIWQQDQLPNITEASKIGQEQAKLSDLGKSVVDCSQNEHHVSAPEETIASEHDEATAPAAQPAHFELAGSAGQSPEIPVFYFVESTDIEYDVDTTLKLTTAFNPDLQYYILSTQDQSVWRETGQLDRLQKLGVHYIRVGQAWQSSQPEVEAFRRVYHHRSVNPFQYERLCFERWFYLKYAALHRGLEHVIISDVDIVLFGDILGSPFAMNPAAFVAVHAKSTHFAAWRTVALTAFCDFMLSFYQRPRDEIDRDIETWGIENPEYGDHGDPVPHFSDMYLLTAFLATTNLTQTMLGYDDKSLWGLNHPNLLRPSEANFQTCDSIDHFDSCVGWRGSDRHRLMAPFFGDIALIGIHFQGPDCKQRILPHMLSRAMGEGDNGQ